MQHRQLDTAARQLRKAQAVNRELERQAERHRFLLRIAAQDLQNQAARNCAADIIRELATEIPQAVAA